MALTGGTTYEALTSFYVSDGSKSVAILKGDFRLGLQEKAINSEPLWIVAGSTQAEKTAAIRAAGCGRLIDQPAAGG